MNDRPISADDRPAVQPQWGRLGLAAAFLAGLILSAQAVRAQTIKKGGTLIAAIIDNPPHLITGLGTNISTIVVGGQIFNTLIKVDRDFKVVPSLAKSWEASSDGLQYTFRLEPKVTWHDGKPFTSEDVKFTFLEMSGKYNSLAIAAYKDIASIETPDPLTVVVKLKASDPSFFPWAFSQPNFAQIFPKHIYQGSDPRNNPANLNPIGTGPFVFKEWVRGSYIAFERNPKYFRADHIFIDKLIFQIIPEPGARQIALERGDVDHIPYFALATSSIDPLSKNKDVEIVDTVRPAFGEIIMIANLRHPILSNRAVRKAIAFAIDREVIVKLALSGHGRVATGPIRTDNKPFYTPDVPKYSRDVARANKLLDEAGFPRQSSGTRFSIKLTYEGAGEGGALQAAGEIMREQLRAVGINLQLQPADAAGWMDTFSKLSFELSLGSYGTGPDPKIAVSRLYLSSNIRNALGSNAMGYNNPAIDTLLRKADAEMNPEIRARLYQDAQRALVDDLPAFWLWEKFNPIASRKGLLGLPSGSMHSEVFEDVGWSN